MLRTSDSGFPRPRGPSTYSESCTRVLSLQIVSIFLDHRIRKQLLAHPLHLRLGLGAIHLVQVHFHVLADPHIGGMIEPE